MSNPITSVMTEKFLRYVAVTSQSKAGTGQIPSSEGQLELAKMLAGELEVLGLKQIHIDDFGILTAYLPGTVSGVDTIGFVAHLDTVDVNLSPDVKPQILRYEGEDLCLNADKDIWIRSANNPEIDLYKGEEIIFSDGTSVLGADNKASVAIVMTMLEQLITNKEKHGDIYVAFVPDEEIGLVGSKHMDLTRFPVDYAYTIDSCELGEVVYETFNAATVNFSIEGVTAHPMSAYGVLVNPVLVAHDIMSEFDRKQTPEWTKEREGYWWFAGITGNQATCQMTMMIRDHDLASYEARKAKVGEVVEKIRALNPKAKIDFSIEDVYSNISNAVDKDHHSIQQIYEAMAAEGVTPKTIAMRGGTDGSALSKKGLVVPNYFTGGHNFHSCFEFLPLSAFQKSYDVTRRIVKLVADKA
ncbi:peptidase T [Rhodobacteraceae bacterium RKSG542]|uniref:peptidase T n=1 Tax=Pseudovibrio flavus TaxID=2529854 RepID=UPI0012BCEE4F|nr:peptidase T [Pseudovibrio flavus]MTI16270.1 peptidase T [Pseudovibrio flavus]